AKIINESQDAFIPGPENLYVDGNFVATISVPAVSPQETSSCPLGTAIHVPYLTTVYTAWTLRSAPRSYTQGIDIANTKSPPIANLKVVDIIPVSQDERIEIKLLAPPL
ncbi:hypothetical protein HYPSUDRAFT_97657, partial [Hypholoma sublateritium FD-334 SS-4]